RHLRLERLSLLQLHRQDGVIALQADAYRLVFHANRPFVDLHAGEQRIAELFPFSAVHPLNGRDDTYQIGEWTVDESPDEITVSIRARSTAWTAKIYTFRCGPSRFTYGIEVEGSGALAEVDYFGGWYSASLRWGSGYFWSGQRFAQVFNPEPNIPEVFHVPSGSGTKIDLTGVPIPARGDWFFTPAPFCFAGQYSDGWLARGVEADQGSNTHTQYSYHGDLEAFHLSLSYEGHTQVNGVYSLPSIGFDFAPDEYAAIAAHVAAVRASGQAPIPAPA